MVTRALLHGIDTARVEAAIREAERHTSAELRVAIARFYFWGDVRRAASHAFARLRMRRTPHRNGVLIFVAPRRRQLAVIGDVGLDERVPAVFWSALVAEIQAHFRRGALTDGLIDGVARIGAALAATFPSDPGPRVNALPDAVAVLGSASKL